MDSNERVIQALHEFENMTDADKVLTQELEELFIQIAHTGRILIPWIYLKPVFMFKLDRVMRDFFESSPSRNSTSSEPTHTAEFDVMRQRLLDCIESFTSAPFTVQRLCELMIEPKRHYKSSEKFMRGIEKNVLVVSTMADIEGEEELTNNHESTSIPNGPVTNGIITTGLATEMTSVIESESNGQHTEYYHDKHYPSTDEIQHINGTTTPEKSEDSRIETTPSIDNKPEETPSEQAKDDETKTSESEDLQKDKCSDDDDDDDKDDDDDDNSSLEEKPLEQESIETTTQEIENTEAKEDKTTDNTEEEKSAENKEEPKEDSQEQKHISDEKVIENKQQDEEVPESTEEPMEE